MDVCHKWQTSKCQSQLFDAPKRMNAQVLANDPKALMVLCKDFPLLGLVQMNLSSHNQELSSTPIVVFRNIGWLKLLPIGQK
jgi:hypothetical protein